MSDRRQLLLDGRVVGYADVMGDGNASIHIDSGAGVTVADMGRLRISIDGQPAEAELYQQYRAGEIPREQWSEAMIAEAGTNRGSM